MRSLRYVTVVGILWLWASMASANDPQPLAKPGFLGFDLTLLQGPDGHGSTATAILTDPGLGQYWVVGSVATASGQVHAALWQNGVLTDLGTLGGPFSIATGIAVHNNGPLVVGQSRNAGGALSAFVWESGAMRELVPGRVELMATTAANNSRNTDGVVVGSVRTGTGSLRAVIWREGAVQDLNRLLLTQPHDVTLADASAVDDHGNVVGTAIISGKQIAYLLSPVYSRAPTITGVTPSTGTQGQTLNVTVHGHGFVPGATANFGPGVTVNTAVVHSVGVISTGVTPQLDHILALNITVSPTAPAGTRNVIVTNPDTQAYTRVNAFSVVAAPVTPKLAAFDLSATTVKGGTVLTGNVTLTDPAGRRGAKVTFKSSKRGFAAPAARVIRKGATTLPRPFNYRTRRVRTTTTYSVTASFGGVTRTVDLTLTP